MPREVREGKLPTHFSVAAVRNGESVRPNLDDWLYRPQNVNSPLTSPEPGHAGVSVSPVGFPHSPLPCQYSQIDLYKATVLDEPSKIEVSHIETRLSQYQEQTCAIKSCALILDEMSEGRQLLQHSSLKTTDSADSRPGVNVEQNNAVDLKVSETSGSPITDTLSGACSSIENSTLPTDSNRDTSSEYVANSDQIDEKSDSPLLPELPWDPGEVGEYRKPEVPHLGIPPEGIGVQDIHGTDRGAAYVRTVVNGFESLLLLDTGANRTIISTDFARFMGLISPNEHADPSIKNRGANGSPISSYGFKPVDIEINGIKVHGEALVCDVNEVGFIGMDILAASGATINFEEMYLQFYEQKVPLLTKDGKRIVNSLFTTKTVILPKLSENVISLKASINHCQVGLVEPRNSVLEHYKLVGASNLGSTDNLKIRLINTSEQDVRVPAGTSLAYITSSEYLHIPEPVNSEENLTDYYSYHISSEISDDTAVPEHVKCLYDNLPSELSDESKRKVKELLIQYQHVFSKDENDIGYCPWIEHEIRLLPGAKPVRQPPYRVGHHANQEIESHVQKLLDKGWIERVVSPWSSPCLLIPKKDGKTRFVQDYRKVNACSEQDSYPLPRQDESLEALCGAKYFTTADLTSGYYQVPLSEDAKKISCFVTKSGTYGFRRMPMGLNNASGTFERLMETVMRGLQWEELLIYMDDIIVFSSDESQHIDRLARMLSRLQESGLKIKPSKTHLFQREVQYLGHVVNEHGIHTDPKKIEAISKIPSPKSVPQLRSFLGLTGYYRKFIPNYGGIANPLCKLLKKKAKYIWSSECEEAFLKLKAALTDHSTLAYPDYSKLFILDTDASYTACGAILSQNDSDDNERPIAYYSFALNNAQKNYGVTKLEMLALVSAIRHFRPYLYGSKFLCRVDHHSLIWLKNMRNPMGILARWLETLSNYNFTVEHRPGKLHTNVDALSRLPYDNADGIDNSYTASHHIRQITPVTQDDQEVPPNRWELDLTQFIQAQNDDPDIKRIKQWINDDIYPPNKELKKFTRAIRFYLGKRDSLVIRDDVLSDQSTGSLRPVIPHAIQSEVISSFHSSYHEGIDRTYKRISIYYFWHLMHSHIRDFVQLCEPCQMNKTAHNHTRNRNLDTGAIMDQVSIDIFGSFRPTKNDNTVILLAIEHFSRWAEAYPLTHATAENIASALYQGLFSRFGFCRILHMDGAAYFRADLMTEMAKIAGCKNTFSCRYHPQGNSLVERLNGTLVSSLRTTVQACTHQEWDELVSPILMAYRATPHPATGVTPNRLMLIREARLPQALCPAADPEPVNDYIKRMDDILYEVYNTQRNIQAEEGHFDGITHIPFKVNDFVWIQKKRSQLSRPSKLESRFYGPYKVVKVLDFDSHVIDENGREVIDHHSNCTGVTLISWCMWIITLMIQLYRLMIALIIAS